MRIAILSAMEEECASLIEQMSAREEVLIAGRTYYKGMLWGKDVVVVFSRWGKVAAASTTVVLIREFSVTEVIFTGVAGAIDQKLNVGDVVVGDKIYQHDMDARPLLPRYEIPLLGIAHFETDSERQAQTYKAANKFVNTQFIEMAEKLDIAEFNISRPKVVLAGIATGDQFISCDEKAKNIRQDLPGVVCVEMEGGAVAQVCSEYGVKFTIIRTISDSANDESSIDFAKFIKEVAREYSLGIIRNLFEEIT